MNMITSCNDAEGMTVKKPVYALAEPIKNVSINNNDEGLTPEVAKLKAKFLKRTKDAFREVNVKVPNDLEMVLISKHAYGFEWIVKFHKKGKEKLVRAILYDNSNKLSINYINYIERESKNPKRLVYSNF